MPNSDARKRFLRSDPAEGLRSEFTEARLLRLAGIKPIKIDDISQARQALKDAKRFRTYMRDSADYAGRGYKKGWQADLGSVPFYMATSSRIARFDLLIEDLQERVDQLKAEERRKTEALQRSRKAARQFALAGHDEKLAGALWHSLETAPPTTGFVYLKRWVMPDASCWFKVGITNTPDRREAEQNVLPDAAETIACVDVGSMDRARAIEATVHQVLEEQRITDANNRELFHLSDQQASAVKAVLEKLE